MKEFKVDGKVYQLKEFLSKPTFSGYQKRMVRMARLQKTAVKMYIKREEKESEEDWKERWKEVFESLEDEDVDNLDEIIDLEMDIYVFLYQQMIVDGNKKSKEEILDNVDIVITDSISKILIDHVTSLMSEERMKELKKKVEIV